MLLGREELDDAVQRLVGVVGVQGCQAQVAGLGKLHRIFHGLPGPDLTDQDDVRGLPQGVFQGHLEALGVDPHLTLGHNTALVLVHEFDRVLDGNDVPATVPVTMPQHGGQRGGLTGTGGAHEDDQASLGHGQVLGDVRQGQIINLGNLYFDPTQHHATQVALEESADPETADTPGTDGKIALVGGIELRALLVIHRAIDKFTGLFRSEGILGDRQNLAVDLHAGRHTRRDKQVRTALLHHQPQQFFKFHLFTYLPQKLSGIFALARAASREIRPFCSNRSRH